MAIARVGDDGKWVTEHDGRFFRLEVSLAELLALPLARAGEVVRSASEALEPNGDRFLVPLDVQEIWAAGVTYSRSRDGRVEEATDPSIYDRVYVADRPEVFFKATAGRAVADGEPVGIRADSTWDVPEPELGLVLNSSGELFGYLVANDMSSRSIEGENPLYLPQAKVYDRSCAIGARIVPVWDAPPSPFAISMSISRDGDTAFAASTSTGELRRSFEDLATWLFRAVTFEQGAVLLTGTGIVPDSDFTLLVGDVVSIEIDGIGTLSNPVISVGGRN